MAEGEGLELSQPFGRRFSRPLQYHYANPPKKGALSVLLRNKASTAVQASFLPI